TKLVLRFTCDPVNALAEPFEPCASHRIRYATFSPKARSPTRFAKLSSFMSPARQLLTGVLYVCASALYAQTLAITDVNVVDVVNGRIRSSQTVLIRNGMIIAVGRSGSVEVPPMATRIAAMSRFLIPGLWDMHVHLRSDENRQDRALVKENETLLGLFVPNGVIGIRDMGGDLGEHVIRWRD